MGKREGVRVARVRPVIRMIGTQIVWMRMLTGVMVVGARTRRGEGWVSFGRVAWGV